MRVFVSFVLSLIIYILVLIFLYFALIFKKPKKEVLIHHAIIIPQIKIKSLKNKQKSAPKSKSIKTGSKSNITKNGKISIKDIFKNVNENIPTKKIKLQKEEILSRFKANDILKNLKKVKNINVNISYKVSSTLNKNKVNELIQKIGKVWYEVSNIAGEYAKIKFVNLNGNINVYILDTNLNEQEQEELINKLKNIKFDENVELTIKFQTKVDK